VKPDTTTTTVKLDSTTSTTSTIAKRDLCPNIPGVQTTIPAGMFVNAAGNCVPRIVDLCPNIPGVQTTIPAGMFVNAAGNCVPRIVDLCPNIPGVQTTIPAGAIVNAAGNCVHRIVVSLNPNLKPRPKDGAADPCAIGATGPGGGIVFYDAGSHQPWGRCLEAAPVTWKGGTADPSSTWGCLGRNILGAQGTAIGKGRANTTAIVNSWPPCAVAASEANNLVFGGKSDWFLPSIDELNQMYVQRAIIGGLSSDLYWSSTQYNSHSSLTIFFVSFVYYQTYTLRSNSFPVRPIRAFG
jgi:hypothetical protein